MHIYIASTTHEHATTAKVYTYEGDCEVFESGIRWKDAISHGEIGTQHYALDYRITYHLRCYGGDGGRTSLSRTLHDELGQT